MDASPPLRRDVVGIVSVPSPSAPTTTCPAAVIVASSRLSCPTSPGKSPTTTAGTEADAELVFGYVGRDAHHVGQQRAQIEHGVIQRPRDSAVPIGIQMKAPPRRV